LIAPHTAADPVREASAGRAERVTPARFSSAAFGRFTEKHAREIEARANRVLPKGVIFHEIAMLDPLYAKFGGIVIANKEQE
jgi:hypothetical protein